MRQQRRAAPRRVKTNKPGVYKRVLASGEERFEISFTGSDGRRRWKMVTGGIRAADRERRAILATLDRGEKVEPSRQTFADFAERWLASQTQLRPRTQESHELMIRVHLKPRLGRLKLQDIDADRVVGVIAALRAAGKSPATIRIALGTLGRVMGHVARRGLIGSNPVSRLERGSARRSCGAKSGSSTRTRSGRCSRPHQTLLAVAVFAGLRQGEILGLVWEDIDFDRGVIRVRKQLDRRGVRVDPKTPQAVRDVAIMPALGRMLREHKLASPFTGPTDFAFSTSRGTALSARNVAQRGLERAVAVAALNGHGNPKLRFHDLRHAYASLLIDQGESVVWIFRQLGHASPSITLNTYAHVFARQENAERMRGRMEERYGHLLDGEHRGEQNASRPAVPVNLPIEAEPASLRESQTGGD